LCNAKQKAFQVDHIVQYSIILFDYKIHSAEEAMACKPLWDPNNGRTLCISCHEAIDSFAGRGKQLLLKHVEQQKAQ